MLTEVEPPWVVYSGCNPTWSGWRGGEAQAWKWRVWFPYWRRLTCDERIAYVDRWDAPPEWREMALGHWLGFSRGEGSSNMDPLRWPATYSEGPWPRGALESDAPWYERWRVLGPVARLVRERWLGRARRRGFVWAPVQAVERHVAARSEESRLAWGANPRRLEIVEIVCETARECSSWPSSHFIPEDPAEIVLAAVPGELEQFAAQIARKLEMQFSESEVDAWLAMTVGEVVDSLRGRRPPRRA